MGKPTGKKKKTPGPSKPGDASAKHGKTTAFDEDTAVFITMSQELKEEGNKLFQKRDHEGAMLKYEKALKLLPKNHIDIAYLRSNMASCYMQMGIGEYPRAINQCNLAIEVSPKYSKALLKRAKCYEALNRLDLALKDVNSILSIESNNLAALEIADRVKKAIEEKGIKVDDKEIVMAAEYTESPPYKDVKQKTKKKKSNKTEVKKLLDKAVVQPVDKAVVKPVDKAVVEENVGVAKENVDAVKEKAVAPETAEEEEVVVSEIVKEEQVVTVTRPVKLVFNEDIRWAQLPVNCSIRLVRDIVQDRFPSLKGILVKYRDHEGDLVTITTNDELRFAEASGDPQGSLRLYVAEVSPDHEPLYEGMENEEEVYNHDRRGIHVKENGNVEKGGDMENGFSCIDDWIVQFARLFKNYVGFNSDSYLDLHELGMKLYSEAMEDAVTSEEAQELFEIAADKFQEMAALALFNWGNVHMSMARKRVFLTEDGSRESIIAQIKTAYEWAQKEYIKASLRYEEALKIKPDFYEGHLALGLQQFEQAKLSWYYAIGCKIDLESGPSMEVLQLYNKAEDSMERGMLMWEEMEERRLNGLSKLDKYQAQLQKMGLDALFKDISANDVAEQAANMKSQIYLLWGTLLYERSIVEFKLGLLSWEECLEVAVEKFELAGASPTDIAVMIKNHCSNGAALEGLGFDINEIVQAWNEMYDAKRWQIGVPSFRLEPLFRRRVPKLHHILEHI
ncbi:hypothetical protein PVL29_004433 [Vitis rotundifolia]|uniref:PB1 domain-containing protein n=1 Tax=Vitis rotundifolia TaxID=103349 RepID=A0AA39DYG2_VITRO|nr:hypothetical protein PVL29_004433 [Vitis rotundifolia]